MNGISSESEIDGEAFNEAPAGEETMQRSASSVGFYGSQNTPYPSGPYNNGYHNASSVSLYIPKSSSLSHRGSYALSTSSHRASVEDLRSVNSISSYRSTKSSRASLSLLSAPRFLPKSASMRSLNDNISNQERRDSVGVEAHNNATVDEEQSQIINAQGNQSSQTSKILENFLKTHFVAIVPLYPCLVRLHQTQNPAGLSI